MSINVSDFDAAVTFCSRLFGTAPAKLRPDYANFAIDDPPLKLVLTSPGNGPGGTIDHLGVQVGSTEDVTRAGPRLDAEGLDTDPEPGAICCYARQPLLLCAARQDVGPRPGRDGMGVLHRARAHRDRMNAPFPQPAAGQREDSGPAAVSADWLRLARIARILSWLTLAWMGIEGGVAIGAAVVAGSVALFGFGLDSAIEAMASIIVIWRFTGTRLASLTSERRAQQLVAVSFSCSPPTSPSKRPGRW